MKPTLFFLVFIFLSNAYSEVINLEQSPRYNVRSEPLRLLGNATLNIVLDIKVSSNWTVGPELGIEKYSVTEAAPRSSKIYVDTSFIGVRANWFKNGVYTDGLYVAPLFRSANTKITAPSDLTVTGATAGTLFGCFVGYGWFWDSFNMMLGLGPVMGSSHQSVKISGQSGTNHLSDHLALALGEYTFGWTF